MGRPPKPLTGPDDPRHGTVNAYQYHRCRCASCVTCYAAARAEWRNTTKASIAHGTRAGYVRRCRCDRCKSAHTIFMRDYRARKRAQVTS